MSKTLMQEKCIPCSLDTPPMKGDILYTLLKDLNDEWTLVDETYLERRFKFNNFVDALAFVNQVGTLAEEEGHHPDIELGWGRVHIKLITHKIKGLSRNDFILASKIDVL